MASAALSATAMPPQGTLGIALNNANNQYSFGTSTSMTYTALIGQAGTTAAVTHSIAAGVPGTGIVPLDSYLASVTSSRWTYNPTDTGTSTYTRSTVDLTAPTTTTSWNNQYTVGTSESTNTYVGAPITALTTIGGTTLVTTVNPRLTSTDTYYLYSQSSTSNTTYGSQQTTSTYTTTGTQSTSTVGWNTVFVYGSTDSSFPLSEVASSDVSSAQAVTEYIGAIDSYMAQLQYAKKYGADVDQIMVNMVYNRQAAIDIYAGLELAAAELKSANSMSKVVGQGLYFQTGANSEQGITTGIGKATSDILGIGDGFGTCYIKVDKPNAYEVSAQIDIVDNALQYVASQRAKLGAVQNRMEYTKVSVEVSSENLAASESRIRDADMAKEMMNLTSANVLQQAGVSMLTQANQAPQSVLSLLK